MNSRSVLIALSSRSLNVKTQYSASTLTDKLVIPMHLPQHKLCTRKTELALEVKFYLDVHRVYMAMAMNVHQLE